MGSNRSGALDSLWLLCVGMAGCFHGRGMTMIQCRPHILMETFDDENQRAGPIYRIDPTIGRFNPLR